MQKSLTSGLVLLALISFVFANEDRFYTQTQYWFEEQLINHSDPTSHSTWAQRYWVSSDYFVPAKGSVLLYICGEGTCRGVPEHGFVIDLAKRYSSMIVVLEHRYYGNSMPFGDKSFELANLKFLNVHQALDDLAYFLNWIRSNNKYGVTAKNPWYTVGGSYPGALSAWFRYKYPHLTVAALASSAVVNARADYPEFDGQIYASTQKSDDQCTRTIQALTQQAEHLLNDEEAVLEFKKSFNSENLNEGEFLFMFADVFVELVQYGKRSWMCDSLKGKSIQEGLNWTAEYVRNSTDIRQYGSYYMSNSTYDVANAGSRQWTYQTCTEVGWLQTAPHDNAKSMRSQKLTIDFYRQWCKDSFGADVFPNTEVFNAYFGGDNLSVPGLIMTNGDEDPWKHVSLLKRKPGQVQTVLHIVCGDCAHCVDLKTPSDSDSQALKDARASIFEHFDRWIGRHWNPRGDSIVIQ